MKALARLPEALLSLYFLCCIATIPSTGQRPPPPLDRYPDSFLYAARNSWGSDPDFSYIEVDTPLYHYHVYNSPVAHPLPLLQSSVLPTPEEAVYAPSQRTYTNPYDQIHIPPQRDYGFPKTFVDDSSFPTASHTVPETSPYYTSSPKSLFEVAQTPRAYDRPSVPPCNTRPPYNVYDVPRPTGPPFLIPSNSPNVIRGETQVGKGIQTYLQGQNPITSSDKYPPRTYKPVVPLNLFPSADPNIIRGEVNTPNSVPSPTPTSSYEYSGVTPGVPSVPDGLFTPTATPGELDTTYFHPQPTTVPPSTLPDPVFEAPGHAHAQR